MPRPEVRMVTFSIDGREVQAPEGAMLVDGAKYGDVEIPVFCYEPKLGNPVGACRMCLVEIEGIPKLQTACSTPVKDGMVVHTQTERVREAQNSVVEFLLVNHPLDCPVCDKGGECPLQDITFGWGRGISRMVEPKRHFKKPLELSPLIAIDRERCILCYRCVRFSQEVSEDYQLILHERGAHSYVGTFDAHPYVAPFSGNIIELCPVGALTSRPVPLPRAAVGHRGRRHRLHAVPVAVQRRADGARRARAARARRATTTGVDDGWLCDKGRFAYQAIHSEERIVEPLVRDGDELRPASWERALSAAAGALGKARGSVGALAGGATTNEEGFLLQRLLREGLASSDLDSRVGGVVPLELQRALAAPALQATVPDLEFAHTVLVLGTEPVDDAPILDLRIRKGVRRRGVQLAVATPRPSVARPERRSCGCATRPAAEHAFLAALEAALGRRRRRRRAVRRRRRGPEGGPRPGRPAQRGRSGRRGDPVGRARRRRRAAGAAQRRRPARAGRARGRGPAGGPVRPPTAGPARGGRPAERRAPACRRAPCRRRPLRAARSPRPPPTASWPRSTCCTPTRSATTPTRRCGAARSRAPRP